jgi:hypothetical protein
MTMKNTLAVLPALVLACALAAFGSSETASAAAERDVRFKAGPTENPAAGQTILPAKGKTREIPLAASSVKKALPPPCTVTAVRGKTVTLRDFYGKLDTVEVADPAGVQIGDKGFLKNGFLILGIVPE